MKFLLTLLLASFFSLDPTEIAKINQLKNEAEEAYTSGNYEKSVEKYSYLIDSLNIEDEFATMNLAHAYYQLKQTDNAISNYQRLQDTKNESLRSLAYQQLGVLSNDPKTLEKALSYFKEAIKSDPSNDDARYNYELLKKKLEEQQGQDQNQDQENQDENKDQENQDQNKDQKDQNQQDQQGDNNDQNQQENEENQDQKNQEQQQDGKEGDESDNEQQQQENKEGDDSDEENQQQQGEKQEQKDGEEKDSKDQPPTTSQKLEQMNISEEKAKMILEAMKASEIQYIQQNRRKATKQKDTSKPDW